MKMLCSSTARTAFGLLTQRCWIVTLAALTLYSTLDNLCEATMHQSYRMDNNQGALSVGM